jgi:malonate transporter
VAFRFNSYIALALSERLAGPQGLQLIAVLIGVCVPMLNVAAIWPMARHAQTSLLPALVRNPLIIATALGLACNLGGLAVPGWLEPTVARIGGSSIPLGLMAAGAGMRLGSLARSKVLTVSLLAIRHAITPVVAWCLVRLLRLDPGQASVLLIFSACRLQPVATCWRRAWGTTAATSPGW